MGKKYTAEEKAYVDSMNRWFKSQQLSVNSCIMIIRQSKEIIQLNEARVKVESAELESKLRQTKETKKNFEAWKKNR